MFDHLPITQGLHGRFVLFQAAFEQGLGFGNEPSPKHLVHAEINLRAQILVGTSQAEENGPLFCRPWSLAPRGTLLRKWLAGQADDFDCADDPPRILTIDFLVRFWIALGQFAKQVREWTGFQFRPQQGIGRWRWA